ncbi:hypothetical protein PR048_011576 [Dryococelus australis]|uniref:Uncharacterized protein n=1 Tax=Dryococelus australis TaxID=614101 RepID=A0ABQ9HLY9_9NEOP|nr:hypothetical protein PR048_011576 [Dryococelus australis]
MQNQKSEVAECQVSKAWLPVLLHPTCSK